MCCTLLVCLKGHDVGLRHCNHLVMCMLAVEQKHMQQSSHHLVRWQCAGLVPGSMVARNLAGDGNGEGSLSSKITIDQNTVSHRR
jgi:hypothetical protein